MNIRTLFIIALSCNFMLNLDGAQIMVPSQGESSEFAYNIATSNPVPAQGRTEAMPDKITESINPFNSIRTITKISEKIENDQSIITTETWTSKQANYLTWTNAGLAAGALGIGAATYYGLSGTSETQLSPAHQDSEINNQIASNKIIATAPPISVDLTAKQVDQNPGLFDKISMQDIALGAAAFGTGIALGAATEKLIDYINAPLTDAQLIRKYKKSGKAHPQRALKQGNSSATDNFNYGNYAYDNNNIIDENIKMGQKLTNPQLRAQAQKVERRLQQKRDPSPSKAHVPVEDVLLTPDENGYPTIDSIKDLMIKEYFGEDKRDRVTVNIINGGTFTAKMYQVLFDGKPTFFLKMPFLGATSHERLINIQQSSLGRLGIEKMYYDAAKTLHIPQKNLPIMTWVEKIYKYTGKKLERRDGEIVSISYTGIIEMSHAAQGKPLFDILFSAGNDLNKSIQCLIRLGRSLAYFQQAFMKYPDPANPETWTTFAHRDFHTLNIFYDIQKSQVYFIDNESMQDNAFITEDVNCFIAYMNKLITSSKIPDTLYSLLIASFLASYIDSFPVGTKPVIAQFFKNDFTTNQNYINFNNIPMPKYQPNINLQDVIDIFDIFISDFQDPGLAINQKLSYLAKQFLRAQQAA